MRFDKDLKEGISQEDIRGKVLPEEAPKDKSLRYEGTCMCLEWSEQVTKGLVSYLKTGFYRGLFGRSGKRRGTLF